MATKYGWDKLPPLKPLDIALTRSDSVLSCGIAWFTRGHREGRTWARHVELGFNEGQVFGSVVPVSRIAYLRRLYFKTFTEVVVFRSPVNFTPKTNLEAQQWMVEHSGRKYGWWRFFPEAADGLLAKLFRKKDIVFFRRALHGEEHIQCSTSTAECFKQILDVQFMGVEPKHVTPDDIADHVVLNKWPCVWATSTKAYHDIIRTSTDRRNGK